jgi:hypothetical protein
MLDDRLVGGDPHRLGHAPATALVALEGQVLVALQVLDEEARHPRRIDAAEQRDLLALLLMILQARLSPGRVAEQRDDEREERKSPATHRRRLRHQVHRPRARQIPGRRITAAR